MREDIEEFKRNNGNIKFSQKEILMFIANRMEKLDIKINKIDKETTSLKAGQKYHWAVIGMLITAIGYLYLGGI